MGFYICSIYKIVMGFYIQTIGFYIQTMKLCMYAGLIVRYPYNYDVSGYGFLYLWCFIYKLCLCMYAGLIVTWPSYNYDISCYGFLYTNYGVLYTNYVYRSDEEKILVRDTMSKKKIRSQLQWRCKILITVKSVYAWILLPKVHGLTASAYTVLSAVWVVLNLMLWHHLKKSKVMGMMNPTLTTHMEQVNNSQIPPIIDPSLM